MSINLSGLKKVTKKATTEKPILPDPKGELIPLVEQCVDHKKVIDARTGTMHEGDFYPDCLWAGPLSPPTL